MANGKREEKRREEEKESREEQTDTPLSIGKRISDLASRVHYLYVQYKGKKRRVEH